MNMWRHKERKHPVTPRMFAALEAMAEEPLFSGEHEFCAGTIRSLGRRGLCTTEFDHVGRISTITTRGKALLEARK